MIFYYLRALNDSNKNSVYYNNKFESQHECLIEPNRSVRENYSSIYIVYIKETLVVYHIN